MAAENLGRSVQKHVNIPVAIGVGLLTLATGGGVLAIAGRMLTWGGAAKVVSNAFNSARRRRETTDVDPAEAA